MPVGARRRRLRGASLGDLHGTRWPPCDRTGPAGRHPRLRGDGPVRAGRRAAPGSVADRGLGVNPGEGPELRPDGKTSFMKPCISQATTLSTPFEADLAAYARGGWSAVELWLTKLETFLESRPIVEARSLLDAQGLKAVAAATQGGLLFSQGPRRDAHWDHFRRRLAILQELRIPTLIVAADPLTDL